MTVRELFEEWRAHAKGDFSRADYVRLGNEANKHGESLLGCDIAQEGLKRFPDDLTLRQIHALALARTGCDDRAREILTRIRNEGHDDEETLGLLARTSKDIWLRTGKKADLRKAFEEYLQAYQKSPTHYWTGINAATLAFASKDAAQARILAGQVLEYCQKAKSAALTPDYWLIATIAEAELLLGHIDQAEREYTEAGRLGSLGQLFSTWRNALIALDLMRPEVRTRIERAFRPPKVAFFQGADLPTAANLAQQLTSHGVRVAFSQAETDQDLAFIETAQAQGLHVTLVLPCNAGQFCGQIGDANLLERYRRVSAMAEDVVVCSADLLKLGGVGSSFAFELTKGLAKVRARQLENDPVPIGSSPPATRSGETPHPGFGAKIRAMLFADTFHFSRLSEDQIPLFISEVSDQIARLCRTFDPKPEIQNTWGDAFIFGFESVVDAGRFALRMASKLTDIQRGPDGLPDDLGLRIALHAGPVYYFQDRITGHENYLGSHVNMAARIEPIAPPGKIYVSDAFAALATLKAPSEFRFDYVGRLPLAKGFGESPLYELKGASTG